MKILIIGAEGQVGHFLARELEPRHQMGGTSLLGEQSWPALDIRNPAAVDEALSAVKPDYVILTAALTHVDQCEEKPEMAEQINVRGPAHVAQACQRLGAGLAFFSSEYVFDGKAGPYSEEDPVNPESVYGKTKLAGEKIVSELVPRHLIVRTTVVYSYLPGSVNFFMQVLGRAQQDEPIRAPGDQVGNPTQAFNLAQALAELIEQDATGIFNLVGTTRLGRDAFARNILEKLGKDPSVVQSIATRDLKQKAPRPLIGGLKTEKAQTLLKKHPLWDLDRALEYTLKQMKEAQPAS